MRLSTLVIMLASCAREIEGDVPGECTDGADNDRDGTYDCLDPDCVGSPDCQDGDTTQDTVDDTIDTDDTLDDPSPLCASSDGWTPSDGGNRSPGPHEHEIGLVSAYEVIEETYARRFGSDCGDTQDPDWQGVFTLGQEAPVADKFNYVFYRVATDCVTAMKQRCDGAGGYPDGCSDDGVRYTFSEQTWTAEPEAVEEGLDPLLVPGCVLTVTQTPMLVDDGATGTLTYHREIGISAGCPGALQVNDGCTVDFVYDTTWAKAE